MIVFHIPENTKRLNGDSILVSNSNKHAQQQFTVASPSDRQLGDNILSTKGIDFFEGEIQTVVTYSNSLEVLPFHQEIFSIAEIVLSQLQLQSLQSLLLQLRNE